MTVLISPASIHPYDDVAAQYDNIWSSPEALAEDKAVMDAIAYKSGSVLDIGCGTGLFLDHYPRCTDYFGVDPSPAMLKQLHKKHPTAITSTHTFEGILEYLTLNQKRFDLILSLFGSPSYIDPKALKKIPNLLAPNGKVFMMFIAPDYTPITHNYIDSPPLMYSYNFADYGTTSQIGNYIITKQ